MLFLTSFIIALAAAATIAVIFARRWSQIRLLDPETIRAEKERRARDRVTRQRFDRTMKRWSVPFRQTGKRTMGRIGAAFARLESRLKEASGVEDEAGRTPSAARAERVARMLREAASLEAGGEAARAERVYVEILKLNPRQRDAYRGLGLLYLANRQFRQAKETFDFLTRIGGADGEVFAGLATIAEANGAFTEAETMRKRALEVEPDSAKRHGELAAFYVRRENPRLAWASAKRACELDPSSGEFLEISIASAILLADRKEAEARYERLRLMGYDRSKLQRLKEKLDAVG
jgi:tetratricopeptide (TPR) repeat protein